MYAKLPKRARSIANPMLTVSPSRGVTEFAVSLTVSNVHFDQSYGCEITKDDKKNNTI